MSANVEIEEATASSVRVPASAGNGLAAIGIDGLFRYRTSNITAAVPGATPGTYDIYVSAQPNDFTNSPQPDTDNTVYDFGLHVVTGGDPAPSGGGIVATRKIGELDYSGTEITEIRNFLSEGLGEHAYSHSSAGSDPIDFVDVAGQIILVGTAGARPAAAGAENKIYLATDTGAISRSNGSAWTTFDDDTKQPLDATLTALAGVTVAADQIIYATGADAFTTTGLTAYARTLLDDVDASGARGTLGLGSMALQNSGTISITGGTITGITDLAVADGGTGASDATTARTNLGLVIGTHVQAFDATLAALAGVTVAANKLIYATGADAFTTTDLSAFGRTLIDDADAGTAQTTLGISAFVKTILDDADAAAVRTTIGAQASDATLTALAGVTVAADQMIYSTGADAFTVTGLTSFARTLLDDANAATARATLGLTASTGWAVTSVVSDKGFDANNLTLHELADVVGTLITHLIATGILTA